MSENEGRFVGAIVPWIVERPGTIVLAFLLLTAVFVTGLDDITMSSGTDQFSESVDAYGTNERVQETFTPPFDSETETTLLLQRDRNVLSRAGILAMLETQKRLQDRESLSVTRTNSAANAVASQLDGSARTLSDQIRVVRRASDAELRAAVRRAADEPGFSSLVGEDFNPRTASASAALGVASHDVSEDAFTDVQLEARRVAGVGDGDVRVFGSGIVDHENGQVLRDSLKASIPTVIVLVLLFLGIAYRDPFDLFLGVISLTMALLWTFGFMGIAGIEFSQLQVSLPPLLLAIGVDFGIHVINRYREEYDGFATASMRRAISHLMLAFFMVMMTSVIGFSANMTSGLAPIVDFGLVAASGIVAMALIFGIFLPAAKIRIEALREGTALPSFDSKPLGAEDSLLGRLLPLHLSITSRLPTVFLLVLLLSAALAGNYGKEVDSSFEEEDMLPPEDLPAYLDSLPGPMQPGSYTSTASTHFLEDNFATTADDTVTIYVEGPLSRDHALETMVRAGSDPPSSFVANESGGARAESIVTVIEDYAAQDPAFAALVDRNDHDGNGVPDDNLRAIYGALLESPSQERAQRYLTSDYREARLVYSVESDANKGDVTEDAAVVADRMRFEATETGGTVVFQRVTEAIFQSAVSSLFTALTLATIFLLFMFHLLERRALLGLVTVSPILVTVLYLVATMRYLGIPFNTLTATLLSITVGVGIDYSIHVVRRFLDEYNDSGDAREAARITLQGTGGALFGSSVTTISAAGALYLLSITPILIQFGILMTLSVAYSFLASVVILPVALILWARWDKRGELLRLTAATA